MPDAIPSALQLRRIVVGANPGAGVEASDSPPTGKSWEVLAYSIVNVQGAANAQPTLVLDDGVNIIFQSYGAAAAQNAQTQRYTWAPELTLVTAGATPNIFSTAPLAAGLIIPPGGRVRTVTVGLGANTDFAAPTIYVVEYG